VLKYCLALALAVFGSSAAHAEWLEASSANFVVYADDSEKDIRRFSDQLERFNAALGVVTGTKMKATTPSARVTVYIVGSAAKVRSLFGEGGSNIGGFYIPRAGGSVAIIPQVNAANGKADWSMATLLHEYSHHFTLSTNTFPLPRWLGEGSAEFFASASFSPEGGVMLGRPAEYRAPELIYARDVSAEELLDPDLYEKRSHGNFDAFYGKSWLLYHYLTFDPDRKGQLARYLEGMMAGKSSREAAIAAFGDLKKLERDIERYMEKPRLAALNIAPAAVKPGPVTVRKLRAGEAAMMEVRIRSRRGVNEKQAAEVVVDARAIAARYPNEAPVLAALAEAEHDAGNDDAAIAAADRALAIDPQQRDALVQKGYSLFRKASTAPDRAAAFGRARADFVALNRIENDHPLPLIYYYQSFVAQGQRPPPLAVRGLERAAELAPFDLGLRTTLAMQQIQDHKPAEARRTLTAVAFNPHGGKLAEAAKKVLAKLDADPAWKGDGAELAALSGSLKGDKDDGD
jgi:tetratricopeptide (TPR) repeat protein